MLGGFATTAEPFIIA